MKFLPMVLANLGRHKRRTVLTILSVSLALFLFAMLRSVVTTLDTIKDPFLEVLGGADREFNRTLGKASYKAIWSLVRDAPAGTTFVIDAWFGFQPRQVLEDYLAQSGVVTTAELWCHAPPAILADRYLSRVHDRPAGHPGESYARELVELAGRAAPLERGPLLAIDTTAKPDFAAISSWLATSLEPIA